MNAHFLGNGDRADRLALSDDGAVAVCVGGQKHFKPEEVLEDGARRWLYLAGKKKGHFKWRRQALVSPPLPVAVGVQALLCCPLRRRR